MPKSQSNKSNNKLSFRDVIMGSVLVNQTTLKWMPMVILVACLGLVMISTHYQGEKILRQIVLYQDSIRDLRCESVTIDSHLLNQSRYSQIQRRCDEAGLGLKKPTTPPIKIKVD